MPEGQLAAGPIDGQSEALDPGAANWNSSGEGRQEPLQQHRQRSANMNSNIRPRRVESIPMPSRQRLQAAHALAAIHFPTAELKKWGGAMKFQLAVRSQRMP